MRLKRVPLLECGYLFLIIWAAACSVNSAWAYDLSKYFPLNQGDAWTYSLTEDGESSIVSVRIGGEEQIGGVKTIKIVDEGSGDDYRCVSADLDGIKEYKDFDSGTYVIYAPPRLVFPNNIEIGAAKKYSADLTIYEVNNNEIKDKRTGAGSIRLESVEDVQVPAGKFNGCLKFSTSSENKKDDGSYEKDDYTAWLAQGVGIVKEISIATEYDAETKEMSVSEETLQLVSAVIAGEKIGDK